MRDERFRRAAVLAIAALLAGPSAAWAADDRLALPLGDGRISDRPQVGAVFSCQTRFEGGGAFRDGGWIQGDVWVPGEKPLVDGRVPWPEAQVTITVEGDRRIFRANALPLHTTGVFPIQPDDDAYQYDRNPNAIRAQDILLSLPASPQMAAASTCVPMGPIGIALTGAAIFNALDALGRDAPAHEIQDHCSGHPERTGRYHYHSPSDCMVDTAGPAGRHSDLVGYALDGFGLYGLYGEDGRELSSTDLDACHGHAHTVDWDGEVREIYHYHLTRNYPYTLGCFRGTVAAAAMRRPGAESEQGPLPDAGGPEAALARAAAELGVSGQALREAVGPPPPNFRRAVPTLGLGEAAIRDAKMRTHGR